MSAKNKAVSGLTRPDGIGRFRVRGICASMSRSMNMFAAQAPADVNAVPITSITKRDQGTGPSAMAMKKPKTAVITTSRVRFGLPSS